MMRMRGFARASTAIHQIGKAHMTMSLHLQDSPNFAILRNRLRAAGFNEESICGRLRIPDLGELSRNPRSHTVPTESDELSFLIRLLLLGETLKRDDLEAAVSSPVAAAIANLGLLSVESADANEVFCPFALYPVKGVLTVSDRWMPRNGKEYEVPADFVYPAIAPNTLGFLAELPETPCDRFVELCSGAGTVALAASRYSRHAWAVDITERSTQVAQFNRLLNGIENVTVLRGDCYEGLEGLQFDRIVAHPPYMPVAQAGADLLRRRPGRRAGHAPPRAGSADLPPARVAASIAWPRAQTARVVNLNSASVVGWARASVTLTWPSLSAAHTNLSTRR